MKQTLCLLHEEDACELSHLWLAVAEIAMFRLISFSFSSKKSNEVYFPTFYYRKIYSKV
jgi:hypothetical protein